MTMARPLTLLSLLLPLLAACGEGELREVSRHPSPDGRRDVVVGSLQAGESHPFLVVMTAKPGDSGGKGARLLLADGGDAPTVTWDDAGHLTIACAKARVWSFRNFWSDPNSGATVAVALKCGAEGWSGAGQ